MAIMNYDPNLVYCGRMAKQTVRLTFGQWKYRKIMEVITNGNCRGLSVIDHAVDIAFDSLPEHTFGGKTITMTDEKGDELECSINDYDCSEEDWLRNMLLSAEIVSIQGKKK